ncbi:MAG: glycosyltransferase family 9 protein [Clostridium sp.]|nr:glycosyltransferase family 9 protein [Clostridium sp.]
MEHLLIIRFSALGDVAMTVPVVSSLAQQYPALRITVVSRDFMRPLFERLPDNVHFIGADLKGEYAGTDGLNRLFNRLRPEHVTAVADFHDVLRTQYLRLRFRLAGIPTAHIHKDRQGRKQLTRQHHKRLIPRKSSFDKYADTAARAGYPVEVKFRSLFGDGKGDLSLLPDLEPKANYKWIGIAPFAAHTGKIYPLQHMEEVVKQLSDDSSIRLFLFGAGTAERDVLRQWTDRYPHTVSVPELKMGLDKELILMSHLDAMLSMDSANMHLASLTGTPVVSVWGATHPYAGFGGWGQPIDRCLQADLPCRPCSIFGNKPCLRHDYACLNAITAECIVNKLNQLISTL